VNGLKPRDPEPGFLIAGFRFFRFLRRHLLFRLSRLTPVAVVRLVVDDHDLVLRVEPEMPGGFAIGQVENRVLDDNRGHVEPAAW
jgi:hypothetical protein